MQKLFEKIISIDGKCVVMWINCQRILQEAKACGLSQSVMTKRLDGLPERVYRH